MTRSGVFPSAPPSARDGPKQLWTFFTSGAPKGLIVCRESGACLAWDDQQHLYIINRAGGCQAQHQLPDPIATAAAADDGSAFAVSSKSGRLSWLNNDLSPRWERTFEHSALGLALDSFGQYLAASDRTGALQVLDRIGNPAWHVQTVKPLLQLAFVPEAPFLIGAADFGLVICHDAAGRCTWRDAPVAHIGSMSLTTDGRCICLACYSDGLRRYSLDGAPLDRLPLACRLAAISADGSRLVLADTATRLHLLDAHCKTIYTHSLDKPPSALAVDALGARAIVTLPDGRLLCFDLG